MLQYGLSVILEGLIQNESYLKMQLTVSSNISVHVATRNPLTPHLWALGATTVLLRVGMPPCGGIFGLYNSLYCGF